VVVAAAVVEVEAEVKLLPHFHYYQLRYFSMFHLQTCLFRWNCPKDFFEVLF
jgi:hypothetical protein